jgi:hypothetical protein
MNTDPTPLNDPRQTRIPIGATSLLPPTLPPARAGRLLGIGRRLLVPTSWVLAQLGLPAEQFITVEDEKAS